NDLQLSEEEIKNLTLYEIEKILNHDNKLIRDEMRYDWASLADEASNMYNLLNVQQKEIFDVVMDA
ncbi:hypothetical protein MKX01_011278, partial [Papaver californicum]